jgi:DNA mismatch repair protein MutS
VRQLQVARPQAFIDLPATTRRNLELTQTLRGDPAPTLLSLLDTCQGGMGSRQLRRWLLEPPRDRTVAQARLQAIAQLRSHGSATWNHCVRQLKGSTDVERITPALRCARCAPANWWRCPRRCVLRCSGRP